MPININGLGTGNIGTDKPRSQGNISKNDVTKSPGGEAQSTSTEDRVKLSPEVKILRKLESEIQGMSDVDQSKIDSIKTALQNGEYKINYDSLASAIERFESDY